MSAQWVVFAEAQGKSGAVKMAWRSETRPSADALAEARAIVSAQYRRLYQEWSSAPRSFARDEAGAARPTFR